MISRCPTEQRKYRSLRNVPYLTVQHLPTVAKCTWCFKEHSLSLFCCLHLRGPEGAAHACPLPWIFPEQHALQACPTRGSCSNWRHLFRSPHFHLRNDRQEPGFLKARKMRLTTAPELPPSNGSLMGTVGKGWGERHSSAGTRPRPIRMEAPGALPSSPLSRDDPQGQEMSLSASPQLEGYAVSEGDVRIVTATAGSPLLRGSTGCGGNRRRRKHPWRLE